MKPTGNCLTEEVILGYLNRELDPEALAVVEEHMAQCELCEEAVEGTRLFLEDHSREELENSLLELQHRINTGAEKEPSWPGNITIYEGSGTSAGNQEDRRPGIRRLWTVVGVAASIVLLVGIGTVINYFVRQRNQAIALAEVKPKEEPKRDRTAVQYLPSPKEVIFNQVEESPAFPGGDEALSRFLAENITCSSNLSGVSTQSSLFVHFVVEEDGSISNVRLVGEMGNGCSDEAIRGIESMPKWIPGKQGGEAVRVGYILMLKFS